MEKVQQVVGCTGGGDIVAFCTGKLEVTRHAGVVLIDKDNWVIDGHKYTRGAHACNPTAGAPHRNCLAATQLRTLSVFAASMGAFTSIRLLLVSPLAAQTLRWWLDGNTSMPSWYNIAQEPPEVRETMLGLAPFLAAHREQLAVEVVNLGHPYYGPKATSLLFGTTQALANKDPELAEASLADAIERFESQFSA